MTDRKIKITFTDKEKKIDLEMIAFAVSQTIRKGGIQNDKRKKVL